MVIPRSRSISIESSTCSFISRAVRPPHSCISRSAKVDLPWSIWAMIEKLRIWERGVGALMDGYVGEQMALGQAGSEGLGDPY